jgi:hypothetical protein
MKYNIIKLLQLLAIIAISTIFAFYKILPEFFFSGYLLIPIIPIIIYIFDALIFKKWFVKIYTSLFIVIYYFYWELEAGLTIQSNDVTLIKFTNNEFVQYFTPNFLFYSLIFMLFNYTLFFIKNLKKI